jgi:hypothetical protein
MQAPLARAEDTVFGEIIKSRYDKTKSQPILKLAAKPAGFVRVEESREKPRARACSCWTFGGSTPGAQAEAPDRGLDDIRDFAVLCNCNRGYIRERVFPFLVAVYPHGLQLSHVIHWDPIKSKSWSCLVSRIQPQSTTLKTVTQPAQRWTQGGHAQYSNPRRLVV